MSCLSQRWIGSKGLQSLTLLPDPGVDGLLAWVYKGLSEKVGTDAWPGWVFERCVLAPKNINVTAFNDSMVDALPGEDIVLRSSDRVTEERYSSKVGEEFLNQRSPPGRAVHNLRVKEQCPLILLINLDPLSGACNGSRMVLKAVHYYGTGPPRVLECMLTTGAKAGETLFIPRVPVKMEDNTFPWPWERRQFPVRPAFAMTINKAQGQTLKCCGIALPTPCFQHGQLYVALSRVGNPDHLRVAMVGDDDHNTCKAERITANVVYTEAFGGSQTHT